MCCKNVSEVAPDQRESKTSAQNSQAKLKPITSSPAAINKIPDSKYRPITRRKTKSVYYCMLR